MFNNTKRKLTEKNKSPLHIAVEKNAKEMLEILLSKGVDINIIDIIYQ